MGGSGAQHCTMVPGPITRAHTAWCGAHTLSLSLSHKRRYCFYHETQNILGNTYGMAVLQVCV